MLTRLNGYRFALNPDLIERAEQTPDTVITLVDGTHYVVAESLSEVIATIQHERAAVLAMTDLVATQDDSPPDLHAVDSTRPDVIPFRRNV